MEDDRRLEPGAGPVLGEAPLPSVERQWTLMIYMAGDNNLESYGRQDLEEIKSVGSSSQVAVVAQFDRMAEGVTRRYYLQHGTTLEQDQVAGPPEGETNTGDPRDLALFLQWGIVNFPAEHYGLVVWNHGTGWKENDVYDATMLLDSLDAGEQRERIEHAHKVLRDRKLPPIFASSVGELVSKGIAYDDTSLDFLDNSELQRALEAGLLVGGVERLSLLGFDACLMNMIEVAYQVHHLADYMVGSQETEPGGGWPYGAVLHGLAANPTMGPEDLGAIIVDAYVKSYESTGDLTQSLLDLALCESLRVILDKLCDYLLAHAAECQFIVGRAVRGAQSFADAEYKDLAHLCQLIVQYADQMPDLSERAQDVLLFLEQAGPGAFVVAENHKGIEVAYAHGVSIYFPLRAISPYYQSLDFAQQSLWDDMLRTFLGD